MIRSEPQTVAKGSLLTHCEILKVKLQEHGYLGDENYHAHKSWLTNKILYCF